MKKEDDNERVRIVLSGICERAKKGDKAAIDTLIGFVERLVEFTEK